MLSNFLLIVFILLSFASFNNVFFPKGLGKELFDNSSSVLLLIAISIVLFILIMFLLQGTMVVGEISGVKLNITSIIEGIMIGWIVALFGHLRRTRY